MGNSWFSEIEAAGGDFGRLAESIVIQVLATGFSEAAVSNVGLGLESFRRVGYEVERHQAGGDP